MMEVKCIDAWPFEPLLVEGATYGYIGRGFNNGECHFVLKDADGEVFTAPSVFLSEPVTKEL